MGKTGAETVLVADNPLWRFACALYVVPGIADICIRLQDEEGCDVLLLLLACWVGAERRCLMNAADFTLPPDLNRQAALVKALRKVRREAKPSATETDPMFTKVYSGLKACELDLERLQVAMLFKWANALYPPTSQSSPCALQNVRALLGTVALAHEPEIADLSRAAEDL